MRFQSTIYGIFYLSTPIYLLLRTRVSFQSMEKRNWALKDDQWSVPVPSSFLTSLAIMRKAIRRDRQRMAKRRRLGSCGPRKIMEQCPTTVVTQLRRHFTQLGIVLGTWRCYTVNSKLHPHYCESRLESNKGWRNVQVRNTWQFCNKLKPNMFQHFHLGTNPSQER